MKYIADHIEITPDEPIASLRKKVAQRLGVGVTGLRVNIIRRRWKRLRNGGVIEVRVEAETNEFIHNTAYFASQTEEPPIEDVHLKRRPVVVGFGIRGLIAAFMLAKKGLKPIAIEAGTSLSSRDAKAKEGRFPPLVGEGGHACLSGTLFAPDALVKPVRDALAEEGIEFNTMDAHQYLPPAFIRSLVHRLHMFILRQGGEVLFEAKFLGTKRSFGKLKGLYYEQEGQKRFIKTNHIVMADGHFDDACYLGFSVEGNMRSYCQCVYGKPRLDAKLPLYFQSSTFQTKQGARCLVLTGLPSPTLLDVGTPEERMEQTFEFNGKNRNAVSFIGTRVDLEQARAIQKAAYVSGKGYTVPYSMVSDYLSKRNPLRIAAVKPMDVSRVQIRSLSAMVGQSVSAPIEAGLFQISKAFPYLIEDGTLLGGLICLKGCTGTDFEDLAKKGIHVSAVLPEKSLDFASEATAGYRAYTSVCAHAAKAH